MKIAIIEDEYIIREGIAKILVKMNPKYEIVGKAVDGVEGLKLIESTNPDLIITDIRMPKMDGLEMLTIVRDKGIQVKAIVLSAYSEFDYAQKAITLGVSEYILKPISIVDLSSALEHIENQLSCEEKNKLEQSQVIYELDNILLSSVLGSLKISEELNMFLEKQYNLSVMDEVAIFEIYLGDLFEEKINALKTELLSLNRNDIEFKFAKLQFEQDKSVILIIYNIKTKTKTESYLQKSFIPTIRSRISKDFAYGLILSNGLLEVNENLKLLQKELQWNLTMDEGTLINYNNLKNIKTIQFLYPIDIENKIKVAIVKKNVHKNDIQAFEQYCRSEIYKPTEIKEACISFCWAVINTAKEVNSLVYQNLDIQSLLKKVMSAITWKEIEHALYKLFKEILRSNLQEDDQEISLVVKRVQGLIHEYYNQGINLDEIATKLNITADYLGKQFKKEIGESYNNYLKNYRINKAKTLLLGTELKVYQIAELIGYSDSKYMSKVFKGTTGYLPNDYRKLHK